MLSAGEVEVLFTSLKVALRALALALPWAILAAFMLSRKQLRWKLALDSVIHLPLVLPPVLVGFILLILFGRRGPIGNLLERFAGVHLAFTANGAALATAVMIFPILVRSIRLSFEATDSRLIAAAEVLRAGPLDRFLTIALPLAGPGILAGTVAGFATAMGEFGAVITFAANIPGQTQTLPLAIYASLQQPGGEAEAWRLATLSLLTAIVGLATAALLNKWAQKRLMG